MRILLLVFVLITSGCSIGITDLSDMHRFEEARRLMMILGEPDNRDAFDRAFAHYIAAEVALAEDNLKAYEYHITRALLYALDIYDLPMAIEIEPEEPKTEL